MVKVLGLTVAQHACVSGTNGLPRIKLNGIPNTMTKELVVFQETITKTPHVT